MSDGREARGTRDAKLRKHRRLGGNVNSRWDGDSARSIRVRQADRARMSVLIEARNVEGQGR